METVRDLLLCAGIWGGSDHDYCNTGVKKRLKDSDHILIKI